MAVVAIPLGALILEEGCALIGGVLVAMGSATTLKFIQDHVDEWRKRSEQEGEPTPILPRGVTFEKRRISNETAYRRSTDGHLFVEDLSHFFRGGNPHYEVYLTDKDLEKGQRHRSVTWDGRPMKFF